MMPKKSSIFKLFLIALIICCLLTTTINGAKITKSKTKAVAKTSEDVTTEKSVIAADVTKSDNDEDDDDADNDDDDKDDDEDDDDDDTSTEESDDTAEKNAVQPAAQSSFSVWGIVRGAWNWIREDISEALFGGADDDTTSAVAEGRTGGSVEGRTFGKIRRLQMALIPIIFKFGVLTAMVAFLVAIGLKTLFLVKVLLAMNAIALLSKFFTLKSSFGHMAYSAPMPHSWNPHVEYVAQPSWGWGPPPSSAGWSSAPVAAPEYKHEYEHAHAHHSVSSASAAQPTKEIHLHIHGGQAAPKVEAYSYSTPSNGWQRSDPYGAYDPTTLSEQSDIAVDATRTIPMQLSNKVPSNHRMF